MIMVKHLASGGIYVPGLRKFKYRSIKLSQFREMAQAHDVGFDDPQWGDDVLLSCLKEVEPSPDLFKAIGNIKKKEAMLNRIIRGGGLVNYIQKLERMR